MSNLLNLGLFQVSGGGVNSNSTQMLRTNTETVGGSYTGMDMMANNGLSANQNQVIVNDRFLITHKNRMLVAIGQYVPGLATPLSVNCLHQIIFSC